jgi:phage baseplate assembly protein W
MSGLSPKFPLAIDNSQGTYVNNTTLKEVIKQNFKNLLLTGPGERLMDNNFGVGLRRYFFEPMTSTTYSDIDERINLQVKRYMPFINVDRVDFNDQVTNNNLLGLSISYSIIPLREIDVLTIQESTLNL